MELSLFKAGVFKQGVLYFKCLAKVYQGFLA